MVKTELTDEALGNAARLVRESMLSSLREEEMPAHEFSEDFRESLLEEVRRNERKPVRTQLVLRRCIAALLSVAVGLSLFFGLNTEARAAALQGRRKPPGDGRCFHSLGMRRRLCRSLRSRGCRRGWSWSMKSSNPTALCSFIPIRMMILRALRFNVRSWIPIVRSLSVITNLST